MKRVFDLHKRRYGGLRIWEELKFEGYKISLYKVRKLMKTQSLRAIQPKSYVPVTTQTHPHLRRSPNLLLNYERISYPNQVIVGDITYLPNEIQLRNGNLMAKSYPKMVFILVFSLVIMSYLASIYI